MPTTRGPCTTCPIIDPMGMFESIMRDTSKFNRVMRGDDNEIVQFWEGMRNDVAFTGVRDMIDIQRSIPWGAHGDKAAAAKTQSLLTIVWAR
eukprot:5905303-Pyramimonas_sp.AAC.1